MEVNRHQAAQIEEIRFKDKSSQANKVAAWVDVGAGPDAVNVRVSNTSEIPIYRVRLYVTYLEYDDQFSQQRNFVTLEEEVVPPGSEPANSKNLTNRHLLKPPFAVFYVDIRFTDAAGVEWIRTRYGRLQEWETFEENEQAWIRYNPTGRPREWQML